MNIINNNNNNYMMINYNNHKSQTNWWTQLQQRMDGEVQHKLQDLKYHADREPQPGTQRAPQGGYEGGRGVPRRLCYGLDIQWHEVHVQLEIIFLEK